LHRLRNGAKLVIGFKAIFESALKRLKTTLKRIGLLSNNLTVTQNNVKCYLKDEQEVRAQVQKIHNVGIQSGSGRRLFRGELMRRVRRK
jgi:hypothetical protein